MDFTRTILYTGRNILLFSVKSIILLKRKLKCHVVAPRSFSKARNSHINQRKKINLDTLFYIKCFEQLRFNLLELIWIKTSKKS
jgi:hypothetical protein